MPENPYDSPLTRRLVHGNLTPVPPMPSYRFLFICMYMSMLVVFASTLTSLGGFYSSMFLLCPMYFIAPPICAAIAANLTSRDACAPHYQLLSLTTIPDKTVIRSYYWASFHRMRVILLASIIFIPALIVYFNHIYVLVGETFADMRSDTMFYEAPSFEPDVVASSLVSAALLVGLWGMNLFALALGICFAITMRHTLPSVIGAPLVVMMLMAIIGAGVALVSEVKVLLIVTGLFLMLLPYGLAGLALKLAEIGVRRPAN